MARKRITIFLDQLSEPLDAKLKESGQTASAYIRGLIAADCGCEPPTVRIGNPSIGEFSQIAHAKRWGKGVPE